MEADQDRDGRRERPRRRATHETRSEMAVGRYELLFYVEEYYKKAGVKLTNPAYLDTVPVRIAIFDATQSLPRAALLLAVEHPQLSRLLEENGHDRHAQSPRHPGRRSP